MITAEDVLAVGEGFGPDTAKENVEKNIEMQNLQQAIIYLAEAVKMVALVLIDIRDGKKAAEGGKQ